MEALVFQVGISGPMVLGLILYTASRRDQGLVHRYLLWLLVMIFVWLVGMVVQTIDAPLARACSDLLLFPPACLMAPLFCVMMLLYARIEVFELRRAARCAVLAPFWFYLLAFATEGWHGQMGGVMPVMSEAKAGGGGIGPLFWSFQISSNLAAFVGLGVALWLARTSPSPDERRRMLLLCAGAFVPLVVHACYTLSLLPLDYPLTPASMGVTSLLLVRATQRYRLLDVQPVARRDVIEASHDAVLLADADGLVVDVNPMALELLGDRRELRGLPLLTALGALGPTEPVGAIDQLLEAVRAGESNPACELETAGGRVLEASAGTPQSTSTARAGAFVVLRDRTKERRAERLLQQSQRLESVGILAAGVAHEVNNPLAFVRANLAHLLDVGGTLDAHLAELPEKLQGEVSDLCEVVEESLAGLDRIQKIVQGLLRLSRTASDRVEACDPNALVGEAARYASLDSDACVRLESRLAQGLPRVEVAPDQIVQVLLNLFLNAKLALRDRPDAMIVASTGRSAEWVEIRVEDNGPGVPEAIRGRIFDPFFTTRAPNEGTGLGLPIAFDILRDHGGSLELEDRASGGACFVVRLPVSPRTVA